MKLEKIMINGYPMAVYKTKKFSTIHMLFLFENDFTRENIFKLDLLEEYMMYSVEKYKTRKEMGDKIASLYSPSFGFHNFIRGDKIFTKATFNLYDPDLVGEDYIKDALEFFGEVLFRPNFSDGHLDKEELSRSRTNLIEQVGEDFRNPRERSSMSFIKFLYPNSYKTRDMVDSKDEYADIMNAITDAELIDMHERLVEHSLVGALLMGNIKSEYIGYIKDIFKFKEVQQIDYDFNEKIKILKDPFYMEVDDIESLDSTLRAVYSAPYKTLKERVAYSVIIRMLLNSGSLMRKVIRDEMKLVYSCSAGFNRIQKNLTLLAFIDKENKDRTLEGFSKVLEMLKSRELVHELLEKTKEEVDMAIYIYDENKNNYLNEMFDIMFKLNITDRKYYQVIKSLTEDDILDAVSKLKLIKVHFYRGVKNEE